MNKITPKHLLAMFSLAIIVRLTFLVFNEAFLELDPYWSANARNAMLLALSDIGQTRLTPDIAIIDGAGRAEITHDGDALIASLMELWPAIDRGLVNQANGMHCLQLCARFYA